MKIEQVKQMGPFDQFCYWIRERHNVWKKRRAGLPYPWSDDEVMSNVFFTSPYRELDKVTLWLKYNLRDHLDNQDTDGILIFGIVCFRWFNWIPTLEFMLENDFYCSWAPTWAIDMLEEFMETQPKNKIFTGAFTISPAGCSDPKHIRVCRDYIDPVWKDRQKIAERIKGKTMQNAWNVLREYPGLGGGGFMAYEVVCDLQHTSVLNATDSHTWTNVGPGARKGINLVLGNENLKQSLGGKETELKLMRQLLESVKRRLRLIPTPDIDMRTIEHSLCEFQKYHRSLYGYGKPKRKFTCQDEERRPDSKTERRLKDPRRKK